MIKVLAIEPSGHWHADNGALASKLAVTKRGAYTVADGSVFTVSLGHGHRYDTAEALLAAPVPDNPRGSRVFSHQAMIVDVDCLIPISTTMRHNDPEVVQHEADAIDQVTSRTSIGESGERDARTDRMLAIYRLAMLAGLMAGLVFSAYAAFTSL